MIKTFCVYATTDITMSHAGQLTTPHACQVSDMWLAIDLIIYFVSHLFCCYVHRFWVWNVNLSKCR